MKKLMTLVLILILINIANAFTGSSDNYNITISNINYGAGDAESDNYRMSFSLVEQSILQGASENYGVALGFYDAIAAYIARLLAEQSEWWFVAIMTSFNGSIFMLFLISRKYENLLLRIPLYIAQLLLIIITVTFGFTALDLFSNTILISGIMQTFFAILLKGILLPAYIVLIIYLIHDSVNKMRNSDLNKF